MNAAYYNDRLARYAASLRNFAIVIALGNSVDAIKMFAEHKPFGAVVIMIIAVFFVGIAVCEHLCSKAFSVKAREVQRAE